MRSNPVHVHTLAASMRTMDAHIRDFDWSKTPLGPSESWSATLRTVVRLLTANAHPMVLWWGPKHTTFYNDAWSSIFGWGHASALGQPGGECWKEQWPALAPVIEKSFRSGDAAWVEDLAIELHRHGFPEEAHVTLSCSAVPDDAAPSGIGGVLATAHEITQMVLAERRMATLHELSARVAEAQNQRDACAIAAETLAMRSLDVPFALLYLVDADGKHARLAGAGGVPLGYDVSPHSIDLENATEDGWPMAAAVRTQAMQVVTNLPERFRTVPSGPWSAPPNTGMVWAIPSDRRSTPAGLMAVGLSSCLPLDEAYLLFLGSAQAQITAAIARARAQEEEPTHADMRFGEDEAKAPLESGARSELRSPPTLMSAPTDRHDELGPQPASLFTLFTQAPLPICVLRGEDLVFEMANEPYLEMIGRSAIVGRPLFDVFPELRDQAAGNHTIADMLRRVMTTREPFEARELPTTLMLKGVMTSAFFNFVCAPIRSPSDTVDRIMVVASEVTEQVVARRRAEHAEVQLRDTIALRDAFLTGAAHELRTPLTTLGFQADGLIHLLQQAPVGDRTAERCLPRAEKLRDQADRVASLIEDMIDVFSLRRENLQLVPTTLDLAEIARTLIERLSKDAKQAHATIQLRAEPSVGRWDRRRIEQILTHLLSNAVKFGGGQPIDIDIGGSSKHARIVVKDRGLGIASEDHERVFGRFVRLAPTTNFGGFGLGLWVVRELSEVMGGSVRVESQPGVGATFVVELPRHE